MSDRPTWLVRRRDVGQQAIRSEIRTALVDRLIPPIAAFVIDYADRTQSDWNDELTEGDILPVLDARLSDSRLIASTTDGVDIYSRHRFYYCVSRCLPSIWIDGSTTIFCELKYVSPTGNRYYATNCSSGANDIYKFIDDDYSILPVRFIGRIRHVLCSADEETLFVADPTHVTQYNIVTKISRRILSVDNVLQILFFRSPTVRNDGILIVLTATIIYFINLDNYKSIQVRLRDDKLSAAVCLSSGILACNIGAGLSYMDPRQANWLPQACRFSADSSIAVVAVDDSSRGLFVGQNDFLYRLELPSYYWIDDDEPSDKTVVMNILSQIV